MKPLPMLVLALLALVLVSSAPAVADPEGPWTEPDGVWPLRPRPAVVHAFAPPDLVWGSGHRGVDLAGTVGQPVRAALSGRISYVGAIAGVGVVVVDHGFTRTTYQPVAARVEVGTEVAAGAVIGTLKWYGTHCVPAACLHWGLVEGDRYLDPLTLVGGPSPVRLLPLDGAPALPRLGAAPELVAPSGLLTAPSLVAATVRYGFPVPAFAP